MGIYYGTAEEAKINPLLPFAEKFIIKIPRTPLQSCDSSLIYLNLNKNRLSPTSMIFMGVVSGSMLCCQQLLLRLRCCRVFQRRNSLSNSNGIPQFSSSYFVSDLSVFLLIVSQGLGLKLCNYIRINLHRPQLLELQLKD